MEVKIRNSISSPPLYKLIVAQGLVILLIALAGLTHSLVAGYSALIGGLICWLPGSYFALKTFRHQGARAAKTIISTMYRAEAVKLVMTAFLFFLAFYFVKPLNPLSLFLAYIGTQTVSWLASYLLTHNPTRNH